MALILHITPLLQWESAQTADIYQAESLATEGFIHCSTPTQVVPVAQLFFPAQTGLVLLCIDSSRVQADIRYESAGGNEHFPHIYGPLNLDAVQQVLPFNPDSQGQFHLPAELSTLQ